jgi:hypothetical protein
MRTQAISASTMYRLSDASVAELKSLAAELWQANSEARCEAQPLPSGRADASALHKDVDAIREIVDSKSHWTVVVGMSSLTVADFMAQTWILGNLLGTPMIQNSLDHKIIEVYDRGGRTIEQGARYHQTKQGAYVHNDGVSDPLPINYLVLACGQKAKIGGESILIDAEAVYAALEPYPSILECLMGEFWFENRGMSEQETLFKAPIISLTSNGEPLIRYFRVYIESAHRKANEPITTRQKEALDFLDVVLDQSTVQRRILLEPGHVLISADDRFLHTRTSFVDAHQARERVSPTEKLSNVNRYMLRMWMRKAESSGSPARTS